MTTATGEPNGSTHRRQRPRAALRRRHGARGRPATARSAARCGSTPAAAPSTRPTPRTTGRCRSASWSRATSRTWSRRSRSAARHGAPILSRGGGTSLAGQCCNVAVVIDCSKYLNRVLAIDPARRTRPRRSRARCSTTCRDAAEEHHLTFAPDPSTHDALHARRHDRQQLLRRPLGDGRAAPSDNVDELEILHLRRRCG